jgi:hypothetical protein
MIHPLGRKLRESYQNFDGERSLPGINYTLPYREGLGLGGCLLIRSLRQSARSLIACYQRDARMNEIKLLSSIRKERIKRVWFFFEIKNKIE